MPAKFIGFVPGQIFGRLTIIKESSPINGRSAWVCRCTCGQDKIVLTQELKRRKQPQCGICRLTKKGQKFGYLTTVEKSRMGDRTAWVCHCACGKEVTVLQQSLRSGATQSCGCKHRSMTIEKFHKKAEELIGERKGHWTVVDISARRAKNGGIYFLCRCKCGKMEEVSADTLGSSSKSCGCDRYRRFCPKGHDVEEWGRNKGMCCACIKNRNLLKNYGITLDEYIALWQFQKGRCAICDVELSIALGRPGWGNGCRAELDHNHDLEGKPSVRGLLCGGRWKGCNRKLGQLGDPKWLLKAATYIAQPPAQQYFVEQSKSIINGG